VFDCLWEASLETLAKTAAKLKVKQIMYPLVADPAF